MNRIITGLFIISLLVNMFFLFTNANAEIDSEKKYAELEERWKKITDLYEEEKTRDLTGIHNSCIGRKSQSDYDAYFESYGNVTNGVIDDFYSDERIKEYLDAGGVVEKMCAERRGEIGYMMYGDFDGYNYIVGIYGPGGIIAEVNKKASDRFSCNITGFIERNIILSCSTFGNTVEVLNRSTNELMTLKQCEEQAGEWSCSINIFNLEAFPY